MNSVFRSGAIRSEYFLRKSPWNWLRAMLAMCLAGSCGFLVPDARAAEGGVDPTFGTSGVATVKPGVGGRLYALSILADGKIIAAGDQFGDGYVLTRWTSSGQLDGTFGTGGFSTIVPNSPSPDPAAIAVQADGKYVMVGTGYGGFANVDALVVRYLTNGTLDPDFATTGKYVIDRGGEDYGYAVTIQADQQILVGGAFGDFRFSVARFQTNGVLDPNFGVNGVATAFASSYGAVKSIIIQSDGKIVAGGQFGNSSYAVARFDTNGVLDASFGNGGMTSISVGFGSGMNLGIGMGIQSDGKIVLAGSADQDFYLGVARFLTDGNPDPSFDSDGLVLYRAGTYPAYRNHIGKSVTIQADGKILVGADLGLPSSNQDHLLVRFLTNGVADSSFGTGGFVMTEFDGSFDVVGGVGLQPDGKIVVVGSARLTGDDYFALVRYAGTPVTVSLRISRLGSNVIFAWPTSATGFNLESSGALPNAGTWSSVGVSPVVVNSDFVVTNSTSGAASFFRLRKN